MLEANGHGLLEDGRQVEGPILWHVATHRDGAERQRQAGVALPPRAEVEHALEALLLPRQLALVDHDARGDIARGDGSHDRLEVELHRLEGRQRQAGSEKSGGLRARHGDALAGEVGRG